MAHPNTEAAPDNGADDTIVTVPHATKSLTVEEAAAEIATYFDDLPAEKATSKREYEEQSDLRDALKQVETDDDGDLSPVSSTMDLADEDRPDYGQHEFNQDDTEEQETEFEGREETEDKSAISAPVSWSKEQQKIFNTLPPAAKSTIVERERERDKGFQVKVTEIAKERKQLQALEKQTVQERQMYAEVLSNRLSAAMVMPDAAMINPGSANYNPVQYYAERAKYDADVAQQEFLQQQAHGYNALSNHYEQMSTLTHIQQNADNLNRDIPNWNDPAHRHQVLDYGGQYGFSPTDIESASPAEVLLLEKAMKYDQVMAKKPDLQKQLKKAPKVQKPGAKSKSSANRSGLAAAKKKLKQTGSVEDAAAVLSHLMKD